jgi:hypothetical protein
MIIRQVMQKKRQSSATIFDKLNKRTVKLTVKNPLNNVLTNDQLFRYYIKEVESKLSQSNDNFPGLPNTTPTDTSIKDTMVKGFGNGKDEYNAGSGGGGGFGPLNSNDVTNTKQVRPATIFTDPENPDWISQMVDIQDAGGTMEDKADFYYNIYKQGVVFNQFIDV